MFAANHWSPDPVPDRLVVFEPATGLYTLVGPIVDGFEVDLTFDDQGRLWMVRDGGLSLVDPFDATETPVSIDTIDLLAVAFHQGTLYGIAGDPFTFWFVEIDPEAGTRTELALLEGFAAGPCLSEKPVSMDFDGAGNVWVVATQVEGCVDFVSESVYFRFASPFGGTPEVRRVLAPGDPGLVPGLAVVGGLNPAVEVPTTGSFGLVLLCGTMVLIALGALARRRRRTGLEADAIAHRESADRR